MDAATLYTVMAVASGPKRMTTERFPTMTICEKVADKPVAQSSPEEVTGLITGAIALA